MNARKSLPAQLFTGLVGGTILAIILGALFLVGKTWNNIVVENQALKDCKSVERYENLAYGGYIDPTVVSHANVINNCNTIKDRTKALLKQWGAKDNIQVYITGELTTFCGELTVGCVETMYDINENLPPIMSISYTADYYTTLEDIVAHELVHTLVSPEELKKLNANPQVWTTQGFTADGTLGTILAEPAEAVADCGIYYFLDIEQFPGSYMYECSPEQLEIAAAVIENRYV